MKKLFAKIAIMVTGILLFICFGAAQDIGELIDYLCAGEADCTVEIISYWEDEGIGIINGRSCTDRCKFFIMGFYCADIGECPPAVPNSTP